MEDWELEQELGVGATLDAGTVAGMLKRLAAGNGVVLGAAAGGLEIISDEELETVVEAPGGGILCGNVLGAGTGGDNFLGAGVG